MFCISPAPAYTRTETEKWTIMYFRQREAHSQITANVWCPTLRCTTCSRPPTQEPRTYTHTQTAQGYETSTKFRGHSLTSRRVRDNEAPRTSLTAHQDTDRDRQYTLTTPHAWIKPLSALSTAGDEMCLCVSDKNQQLAWQENSLSNEG